MLSKLQLNDKTFNILEKVTECFLYKKKSPPTLIKSISEIN